MDFTKISIQDLRDLSYEMYLRDEDMTDIIKLIQEREKNRVQRKPFKGSE